MSARLRDLWGSLIARLTADAAVRLVVLLAAGAVATLVVLGFTWWVQQPIGPAHVARLSAIAEPAPEAEPPDAEHASRVLAGGARADAPLGGPGLAIDYQRRVERRTEERIETLLATVVGTGKAVARVAATIDFARTERTEELVDPERTAVRKSRTSREGATSGQGAKPDARAAEAGEPRAERRDEAQEYEVSKTTSRTVAPMGAVTQLSVAVLVDGTYREDGEARVFVPRPRAELDTLKTLVASAIGISEARGDRLELTSAPFQLPEVGAVSGGLTRAREWMPALALRLLGLGLVLGVVALGVRPLVRALGGSPGGARPRGGEVVVGGGARAGDLARENAALAQQHPERVAELVRQWLIESPERTV